MNKKLFHGLSKQLIKLLDESNELFFEERPYLLDESLPKETTIDERREQNDLEIQKTVQILNKEMGSRLSEETQPEQKGLL